MIRTPLGGGGGTHTHIYVYIYICRSRPRRHQPEREMPASVQPNCMGYGQSGHTGARTHTNTSAVLQCEVECPSPSLRPFGSDSVGATSPPTKIMCPISRTVVSRAQERVELSIGSLVVNPSPVIHYSLRCLVRPSQLCSTSTLHA